MVTWLQNSVIRTGRYQSSCSLCHPCGSLAWKAQSSPRPGMWCLTPHWKKWISRARLFHPVRNPSSIHPGTFSYKNPHSALIVSQNFKLLIYFFFSTRNKLSSWWEWNKELRNVKYFKIHYLLCHELYFVTEILLSLCDFGEGWVLCTCVFPPCSPGSL